MSKEKSLHYADAIANAFSEAKAWRAASVFLGVTTLCLGIALIWSARSAPVVLIPAEAAYTTGHYSVRTDGEFAKNSAEYMGQIALGDLGTVLNWTPENVVVQHKRFINRLTPDAFAKLDTKLLADAEEQRSKNITQSFFPKEATFRPPNIVEVSGTLVRWGTDRELMRTPVTYLLTYDTHQKYLHVQSLTLKP